MYFRRRKILMSRVKQTKTAANEAGIKPSGKKQGEAKLSPGPEQRYRMIQESAYFIAEKAGFSGDNVKYWLAAEKEINEKYH